MRFFTLAIALASASFLAAQDGWKKPDTIKATVVERGQDSLDKTYSVTKSGSSLSYLTSSGIGGELEGASRMEVVSDAGIYTWLEGKPSIALRLFFPTIPTIGEMLATPKFSRGDLEFHLKGIEKALDKRVLPGKEETIAGRPCLVLNVLDRPDSANKDYQKLWIDKETGLTMRLEDYFGGTLTFSREIKSIDLRSKSDPSSFVPAKDAVIIRGVVSPKSLMSINNLHGGEFFKSDIDAINTKTAATQPNWASSFNPDSPFGYAQTQFRQLTRSNLTMNSGQGNSRPSQQQRRGNILADGQSRRVVMMSQGGQTMVVAAPAPPPGGGGGQYTAEIVVSGDGGGQTFTISGDGQDFEFNVNDFFANPQGGQSGNGANGNGNNAANNKPILLASSDLIDPKTGDTVNFVQAHNGGVEGKYAMFILGQPKEVKSQALSEAKAYSATVPYNLNVVTWRKGEVRYGLSSTRLSIDELVALAGKIK